MVRPVIFHSRLYLLWIEKQVQKDNTGKDTASFTLKLTHVKYDGSWASPFSYDITEKTYPGGKNGSVLCRQPEDNSLLIARYQIEKETQPNSFGLHIQPDMSCKRTEYSRDISHGYPSIRYRNYRQGKHPPESYILFRIYPENKRE